MPSRIIKTIFHILLAVAFLSACNPQPTQTAAPPTVTPTAPVATASPLPPTPTQEPIAAEINGEVLTAREFEAELSRLQVSQASRGITMDVADQRKKVLDELAGQVLLAQAARDAGFTLDDAGLQKRIDALAASLGGVDELAQWQADHGYTAEDFRLALARQAAAEYQIEQIAAGVPAMAEQVHVRQILTFDQAGADTALSRVNSGTDFATLAYRYDAVTGGDLGWFPRGFLTAPEVEEAAFALEAGQVSGIIKSSVGYHIIMVIEKQDQRPLSPDALLILQQKAVEDWIASRTAASTIEVFTP